MKRLLTIIFILILSTAYPQKGDKIEKLLDSLKLDFSLTPNQIKNNNLIGADIVWAGKIESIEISEIDTDIQLLFNCKHLAYDSVSNELIVKGELKLRKSGDGNFIVSIISSNMTMKDANRMKTEFELKDRCILTVGKVIGFEKKNGTTYTNLEVYNFYTFRN
jgi:hypothetical protein